jgi:hypothetical protein
VHSKSTPLSTSESLDRKNHEKTNFAEIEVESSRNAHVLPYLSMHVVSNLGVRACAGDAGVHANESPAGGIRKFMTQSDVRNEAARPNIV